MKIKPFKGYRPPRELVEQVSSRPYDVLNSEEAREEAKGNEKSLYHIIKPEINFAPGTDEHDPRVYDAAIEQFKKFKKEGWLVQDAEDKYYVYAQTILASNPLSGGKDKTQFGLVVGAWVDDYLEGRIKKHELTRRDKEEDRMKHVRVLNANMEPVFFAYPHREDLDTIVASIVAGKPEYDFVAAPEGFRHTFWVINDPKTIKQITEIFAEIPAMYIADGHHRSAAAAGVACRGGEPVTGNKPASAASPSAAGSAWIVTGFAKYFLPVFLGGSEPCFCFRTFLFYNQFPFDHEFFPFFRFGSGGIFLDKFIHFVESLLFIAMPEHFGKRFKFPFDQKFFPFFRFRNVGMSLDKFIQFSDSLLFIVMPEHFGKRFKFPFDQEFFAFFR